MKIIKKYAVEITVLFVILILACAVGLATIDVSNQIKEEGGIKQVIINVGRGARDIGEQIMEDPKGG